MGKQSRSKKPENPGKGKVTPVQVAFIVDRYLYDNNYSKTRSMFRNEASSLISKSPVREVGAEEFVKFRGDVRRVNLLERAKGDGRAGKNSFGARKIQVQSLLQGMQSVMNAYNASATASVPMIPHNNATKSVAVVPESDPRVGSPSGPLVYGTPTIIPISGPSNARMERNNYTSPVTSQPLTRNKRSSGVVTEASTSAKKTRSKLMSRMLATQETEKLPESDNVMNRQVAGQLTSVNQSSPTSCTPNESAMHVSGVNNCLFNRPQPSPPTNSSGPKTPPQAVSPKSDKSMTPLDVSSTANCSDNNTPEEITHTNCTIISTERVRVSPLKQMTCYTIERNHCISCSPVKTCLKRPGKRDNVKSRLDFDGSDATVNVHKPSETSTSESETDADLFDLDLPNLDALGASFSFSELLVDLDPGCEGIGYPCQPTLGTSAASLSGSSHESGDGDLGANQVISEFSSTVTEVFSEKGMNAQGGPDTVTSVKSITKCIKTLSPAKGRRSSLEQQNHSVTN